MGLTRVEVTQLKHCTTLKFQEKGSNLLADLFIVWR